MKRSLIVAMALSLCVYLASRCEAQNRPDATLGHVSSNIDDPRPAAVVGPEQIQNHRLKTEGAGGGKKETPAWYKSTDWPLVIVGVITFIVIGWQSFETRRAAIAARDQVALAAQQMYDARESSKSATVLAHGNVARQEVQLTLIADQVELMKQQAADAKQSNTKRSPRSPARLN